MNSGRAGGIEARQSRGGLIGRGGSRDSQQMGVGIYLGTELKGILSAEKLKATKLKVTLLCNHHKQFEILSGGWGRLAWESLF